MHCWPRSHREAPCSWCTTPTSTQSWPSPHGFDLADYLSHDDITALLNQDWDVTVDKRRPRPAPAGIDGQHTHDDIIRARRR